MNEGGSLTDLRVDLAARGDLSRIPQLMRYFQAFDGGYGEGDRFLGVRVPDCRKVARRYRRLPLSAVTELLTSGYHEERLTALLILADRYRSAGDSGRREVLDLYLEHRGHVNNWDLVDTSADKILGRGVLDGLAPESLIDELASSGSLWDNRIAMLSAFAFIRTDRFELPLRIAGRLLRHPEELIHKAVGWMLREILDRDPEVGMRFVEAHAADMPRTMLRYAVEKLPKAQRDHLMRQRR
ncbi:MAG: DNA alkylation repair protein [Spirochaetota bacterium]